MLLKIITRAAQFETSAHSKQVSAQVWGLVSRVWIGELRDCEKESAWNEVANLRAAEELMVDANKERKRIERHLPVFYRFRRL